MLKNFNFKKTALVAAASAVAMGVHMSPMAQNTDQGNMVVNGQIFNGTCLLSMGNNLGAYTLNLPTYSLTEANASSATVGRIFDTSYKTVILKLVAADGVSNCNLCANGKWDVGINPQASDFVTTVNNGRTFLVSQGPSSVAAQNVGVILSTTFGTNPIFGDNNFIDLSKPTAPYGVLLTRNTASSMGLAATDRIALTAQFGRTSSSVATAGAFTYTLPLNVWYK